MRRFIVIALLVVAAAFASEARAYSVFAELNAVASWLAQRDVEVRCLTEDESSTDFVIAVLGAQAYVEGWLDAKADWHPDDATVFKHGHCEALLALVGGDASGYSVRDLALAILILTHESGHLRGHRWSADEAKTECWAIRHFRYVAERLGVSDRDARRLLFAHAVDIHSRLSAAYQQPGCKVPRP